MESIINTRADLDAIAGTLDHETWMRLLAGSIYSLHRNDAEQRWDVVEDTSLIARFEFSRSDFADVVAPTPPEFVPDAGGADRVRTERNRRLSESDWTQLPDAPVDRAAWAAYRQALRDISDQAGFPGNVEWPTEPK